MQMFYIFHCYSWIWMDMVNWAFTQCIIKHYVNTYSIQTFKRLNIYWTIWNNNSDISYSKNRAKKKRDHFCVMDPCGYIVDFMRESSQNIRSSSSVSLEFVCSLAQKKARLLHRTLVRCQSWRKRKEKSSAHISLSVLCRTDTGYQRYMFVFKLFVYIPKLALNLRNTKYKMKPVH